MGDKIYGGTGTIGHLFVHNTTTGKSTDLGQAVSGIDAVISLVAHNGVIYGGTGEPGTDAHLFKYDPASGFTDLGVPIPGEQHIHALVVGADGLIYGGTGWNGNLFSYNPGTNQKVVKNTCTSDGSIRAMARAANGTLYLGTNYGRLLSYIPSLNQCTALVQPSNDNTIIAVAIGADGKVYGGTGSIRGQFFIYDPLAGTSTNLGRAIWGGSNVRVLLASSSGKIYGGSSQLFLYNPSDHPYASPGEAVSQDIIPAIQKISDGYGTINAQTQGLDGKVYFAGGQYLYVFDPVNRSVTILGIGSENATIYALATGADGKIYGGVSAWSWTTDSARMFVYSPASGAITNLGSPVAGERTIYALVTGADGKIYGGTGYAEGHLFVYNPANGTTTDLGRAVSGDTSVMSLARGLDGKIYGGSTGTGHFFIYDPSTGIKVDKGTGAPGYSINALATAPDGKIYGGASSGFFTYTPSTGLFSNLGVPVSGTSITTLIFDDSTLYGGCYDYLNGRYINTLFSRDAVSGQQKIIGQLDANTYDQFRSLQTTFTGEVFAGVGNTFFSYNPNFKFSWGTLRYEASIPPGTALTVDIYSPGGQLLINNAPSGTILGTINATTFPGLKLKAEMSSSSPNSTPRLLEWRVDWPSVQVIPGTLRLAFYLDPDEPGLAEGEIEFETTYDEPVNWTASDDCTWMSVSPDAGESPARISVQVDKSGLAQDTWYSGLVTLNWNTAEDSGMYQFSVSVFIGEHGHIFLPTIKNP